MRRVPPQVYPRPNMDYQSQGYQLGQQFGQPMQYGQPQDYRQINDVQRQYTGNPLQYMLNYGGGDNSFDERTGLRRQPRQFPIYGDWGG